MTTTVSGGGGGGIAGLTSDGANGVIVQDALKAGNQSAADIPDFHYLYGSVVIHDTPANNADGDQVFQLVQAAPVLAGQFGQELVHLERGGNISGADYNRPMVWLLDTTASTQPALKIDKGGSTVLEITTIKSITGALSTVTDAAAKAVLTSIIATLTGIKVATNNTT